LGSIHRADNENGVRAFKAKQVDERKRKRPESTSSSVGGVKKEISAGSTITSRFAITTAARAVTQMSSR